VSLSSGNYYAIGVGWSTTTSVTYYSLTTTVPATNGFGALIYGYSSSVTTPPTTVTGPSTATSATTYPQRLTTGPGAAT
jgi:hypothetical protein